MKTKVFTFNTGMCYIVVLTAIECGSKCFLQLNYSNSNDKFYIEDEDERKAIDLTAVKKWAKKQGCEYIVMENKEIEL